MLRIFQIKSVSEEDERFSYLLSRQFRGTADDVKIIDFKKDNYKVVYEDDYHGQDLDKIWETFNIDHPQDFRGHSLSISDIVEINGAYYRCEPVGWKTVEFTGIPALFTGR